MEAWKPYLKCVCLEFLLLFGCWKVCILLSSSFVVVAEDTSFLFSGFRKVPLLYATHQGHSAAGFCFWRAHCPVWQLYTSRAGLHERVFPPGPWLDISGF